jgi:RNA polymerase sigma-70 factor (ECF subfamily)
MSPNNPEQNILESAKLGNLESFEKILFQYEKAIFNYLLKITGQKQDAEDLAQETFIKLYLSLEKIEADKSFKAWLYKIATNTAYDWLRRKRKQPALSNIEDLEEKIESETSKNDLSYYTEQKEIISSGLDKIEPAHRSILLLYYFQDFSYGEIADILGIPINTVKTHLYRAKRSLKKKIKEPYKK